MMNNWQQSLYQSISETLTRKREKGKERKRKQKNAIAKPFALHTNFIKIKKN